MILGGLRVKRKIHSGMISCIRIEDANWSLARWLRPKEGDPLAPEARPSLSLGAALLPSEWALKTFCDKSEDWVISEQPFPPPVVSK